MFILKLTKMEIKKRKGREMPARTVFKFSRKSEMGDQNNIIVKFLIITYCCFIL